ncbi:hypothetical protein [Embleya hyalina]|uniref:Uncharacterized protein n=1 Tax=Embleya hyalina TaxID=516124 RepID=A0A401Z1B3_9ACTN|nr:hypothetical protein [Embleya hyalina]GCE00690.1 hypothetical protein EHYA_08416 [Embleya hyalina]
MPAAEAIRPLLAQPAALDVGVVCASADGHTVHANPRIEHHVGPVPPGVPGSDWANRFGLARPDGAPYRSPPEAGEMSAQMLSRDRKRAVLMQTLTAPLLASAGDCIGSVGIFRATGPTLWRPRATSPHLSA